jgi:hypothetical protein
MVLSGAYGNLRKFIYELEAAPEFVVVEGVQLRADRNVTGSIVAIVSLSTYYR